MHVVGVDVSLRSLDHAREVAEREGLAADFVQGNYLEANLGTGFDLALLIYEDFSALSPAQRDGLLARVRQALSPDGTFLFDVTAAPRFDEFADEVLTEPNLMDGFWAPAPYSGTRQTWAYQDLRLVLERYTIRREGQTHVYWNWTHCLTPDEVEAELRAAGFAQMRVFGDVAGAGYEPRSPTFAVVATDHRRREG